MIIVDWNHLSKRSVFANRDLILENPLYYAHTTLNMIISIVEKFGVSKSNPLILAVDSYSWRHEFYLNNKPDIPEYVDQVYKGKRVKDETFDWETIKKVESDILEAITNYTDFHVLKVDSAEADDIIAVLCKNSTEQCIIISSDKDFQQLKSDNVSIYDPIKRIFIEPLDVERFKTLHYMIGDKVDNILAIKARMGEKTAEKCIHQLDELLALNPEMKLRYEFNKSMIDFDCIPEEIQKNILTEWKKNDTLGYDGLKLLKVFQKYNLREISEKHHLFQCSNKEIKTVLNEQPQKEKNMESYMTNKLDDFFGD